MLATALALCAPAGAAPLRLEPAGNPHRLEPLPAPTPGAALYPRVKGHLPFGLTDTGWSDTSGGSDHYLSADVVGAVHAAMGATMARMPLYWPGVEPQPGARNWSLYDGVYRSLVRHGVRPLWTLYQTPRHALSPGDQLACREVHCEQEPGSGREGALRRISADLAERYPLAAGIEFRNEPNLGPGLRGHKVAPERYAQLLGHVYDGAQSGNRKMRVLGGALLLGSGFEAYLARMLAAGAAGSMHGLTFHPYNQSAAPGSFAALLGRLDGVLARHGAGLLRLFPDEIGVSLVPGEAGGAVHDPAAQRDIVLSQYLALDGRDASIPLARRVDAVVLFTTIDGRAGSDHTGFGFLGRRGADGRLPTRPVFCAFRQRVGGLLDALSGSSVLGDCPAAARVRANGPRSTRRKGPKAKRRRVCRRVETRSGRKVKRCKSAVVRRTQRARR